MFREVLRIATKSLAYLGCFRINEVLGITWDDISLKSFAIRTEFKEMYVLYCV